MSIILKEDQKRDYDDVNKELKSSNRGALIRPTGTGKSFIALKFIEDNEEKKFYIWLLVHQFYIK